MEHPATPRRIRFTVALVALALFGAACGSSSESSGEGDEVDTSTTTIRSAESGETEASAENQTETATESSDSQTFSVEVWADNWSAVYVNGELVGEDSVPITTERSFNSETFTFEATYPFTLAIEAKDFKETDSGLEYIGERNQQMGDGGLIAQVTDSSTGDVVEVTNSDWSVLIVHRAPLNTDCEDDTDPDATCEYEISETPVGWADTSFDDSGWDSATEWAASDVDPKDGYGDISWDSAAQLIWGADLEVDNTVLARVTVDAA